LGFKPDRLLGVCKDYFLPKIVLGNGDGALTHVGGCSSELLKPRLPGEGLHAMVDRTQNGLLLVSLQLFCDAGDPPPIYEAVVGVVSAENSA
jgi:hypothetical protein